MSRLHWFNPRVHWRRFTEDGLLATVQVACGQCLRPSYTTPDTEQVTCVGCIRCIIQSVEDTLRPAVTPVLGVMCPVCDSTGYVGRNVCLECLGRGRVRIPLKVRYVRNGQR